MNINKGRWCAQPDGDFVVFVIGMRINSWWKVHRWLPPMHAMARMVRELAGQPDSGFLSGQTWFGRTTVVIQYWRSFDHLEAYAHDPKQSHVPAWTAFRYAPGSDAAVGIFHETYRIARGQSEAIFVDMPPTLLGDCTTLVPARDALAQARGRLEGVPETGPRRSAIPAASNDLLNEVATSGSRSEGS